MRRAEIYLAQFPFGDVAEMKLRPVLLITGPIGVIPEILVAYISSVVPSTSLPSDLIIDPTEPDFRSTRLKTTSVLRLHKLATVHTSSLVRRLGELHPAAWSSVAGKLRTFLNL